MKAELSPKVIALVAVFAIAIAGVLLWKFTGSAGTVASSKAEEVKRFEQAKSYYSGIGASKDAVPKSGPPGMGPEYEARMRSQQGN